ncbi:phosphodiester glycosidase family protein [Paenibacillus silviterrae]|uniref:phosphodiester glycosidase family protein n=1 Tax=Paenibacillus silviterrae TaxID=3242194 RepID=UPI002543958A|nr:phosphodiester glycosidase family protein [Paenibacillus chinjuensis]
MGRRQRLFSLFLILSMLLTLLQPLALASPLSLPATTFGQVVDARQAELAPGATYHWYDMLIPRGAEKVHFVSFDPKSPNLKLQAGTKSGKVRGMEGVTKMAAYADRPGHRVVAGINGDFYDISGNATGVPNGLFVGEGKILNSATSPFAFGMKADGTSVYGTPVLTKTVTIGGTTTNLTHINRFRDTNQLVLYTTDYFSSTKTSATGDEVVLDIVEGAVQSGVPLKLKVAELRKDQGDTPLVEGKVVLSASGTARPVLAGLQVGNEVTASFELSGEWADVQVAIGGQGPLLKDGVVQTNVGPAGVHPRTGIGTKADGTVVMMEIDGRAPGFSEGVETYELAQIMADLGVVNAMNLDGGGSSTFVARMPGTTGIPMLNRGSDGGERNTGNSLLLVNTAPELSVASKLVLQPNAERILKGASFPFRALGIDANGHPAPYTGAPAWQADTAIGSIDASGKFTAGLAAGTGTITASAEGGVQGTAEVEVVDRLTELRFPDEAKTFQSNAVVPLSVTALRSGQVVQAGNESLEWRVEGSIGTVSRDGVFTASSANGQTGRIYVKYGDIETSMQVSVGLQPVVMEGFEAGVGKYKATGVAANSVAISEVTDPDFVRFGGKSLKLEYDFTGKTGTSGAYLEAASVANRIQIPGYPQKISMWVYGDGKGHWLRGQLRDGGGAAFAVDYTPQTTGVNWTGWRYVEATLPTGKTTPLTMDLPVRYMETNNARKDAGAIYIDDIRAVYGPVTEDITPPMIKILNPAENATVKTATPEIRFIGEDDGYDPVTHPGTTLIDPDRIRLYVDDVLVQHSLYPPQGRVAYTPTEPLTEGRHKVKAAIRDLSGNQTIKEWYFHVNLGSPQYLYTTPDTLYLGKSYHLDVRVESAGKLKGGHAEFQWNPAIVKDLQVLRGPKLSEAQLTSVIDPAQGTVRLNLADVETAGLTDSDLVARIRYTVRPDVIGPLSLEQAKSEVTRTNTIHFVSGSIVKTETPGTTTPFYGAPVTSTVKSELQLTWKHADIALGYPAVFEAADGAAKVEGATLLLNGAAIDGAVTDAAGKLITGAATQAVGTYQLQAVKDGAYSPVMSFKVSPLVGTAAPRNISVTMGNEASTGRHFTWHTHPDTKDTIVEWVKASEFSGFDRSNVSRTEGFSSTYNTNNDGTYRVHKAAVTGLQPDTSYVYRVGDGAGQVSVSGTFRTSTPDGTGTKLLFFGDSQASDAAGFSLWGQVISKAASEHPDADLLIHAGDMVDHGHEQEQWNLWFDAAQDQFLKHTLVTVVGNHEVTGTNGNGDYLAHFHHPQNGAPNAVGSNFSFDIKDTHFAVMNTEMSVADLQEQAVWLDRDLTASKKRWKVVIFHQGPYGSIYSSTAVQTHWVPVFDKHGVDLVLNGHDHIYLRTFPMKGGAKVEEGQGTRYVVGGSTGPKFYELTPRPWQEVVFDDNTQIYTAVEIVNRTLTVVAKTLAGQEVDRFEIVKPEPPVVLTSLQLDGPTSLVAGMMGQVVTKAQYSNGTEATVTSGVYFQSSNPAAAAIDAQGLLSALAEGSTVISATYGGKTASYGLTVVKPPAALTGIVLEAPASLKVGQKDTAVVKAVYSDGTVTVLTDGVQFTSSKPEVAALSTAGEISALQAGSTVLTAAFGGHSASVRLNVSANPANPGSPSGHNPPGRPGR